MIRTTVTLLGLCGLSQAAKTTTTPATTPTGTPAATAGVNSDSSIGPYPFPIPYAEGVSFAYFPSYPPFDECASGMGLALQGALGMGPYAKVGCKGCAHNAGEPLPGMREPDAETRILSEDWDTPSLSSEDAQTIDTLRRDMRAALETLHEPVGQPDLDIPPGLDFTHSVNALVSLFKSHMIEPLIREFEALMEALVRTVGSATLREAMELDDEEALWALLKSKGVDNQTLLTELRSYSVSQANVVTKRRRLAEEGGLPDAALIPWTSKSMAGLLRGIVGEVSHFTNILTAFQMPEFIDSRMENIGGAACKALEFARELDLIDVKCQVFNLVLPVLACRDTGWDRSRCATAGKLPTVKYPATCNVQGGIRPMDSTALQLEDATDPATGLLRKTIPQDIQDKEAMTYFHTWRAAYNAWIFASYDYNCEAEEPNPKQLVPGWNTILIVGQRQEGDPYVAAAGRTSTPTLIIAENLAAECELMGVIRATVTPFDWTVDLQFDWVPHYGRDPTAGINDTDATVPKFHAGFHGVSQAISPAFQVLLDEKLQSCPSINLIWTGHSMGTGVVQVMSVLLHDYYGSDKLKQRLVLFGVPAALNEAAAKIYNGAMNGRSISYDFDPISKIPCNTELMPSGFPLCNEKHGFIPTGDGVVKYATSNGVIEYVMADNLAFASGWHQTNLITAEIDPPKAIIPKGLNLTINIPTPLQINAAHLCGYACRTTLLCSDRPEDHWMCDQSCFMKSSNIYIANPL